MQLEQFTGVTTRTIDTERRPIGLILKKAKTAVTFGTETLSLGTTGKNAKEFMTTIPIQALAELSAAEEGAFVWNDDDLSFYVNVAESGLALDSDANFTIKLHGLDSTATYTVFLQESITANNDPEQYGRMSIPTNESYKNFLLAGVETLILPTDNLSEIVLKYPENYEQTLTTAELGVIAVMNNDVVAVDKEDEAPRTYGYGDYFIVPVGSATGIKITITTPADGYIFYFRNTNLHP
jgi:hypothetical protein